MKRWLIIKNDDRGPIARVVVQDEKPDGAVNRRFLRALGGGKGDFPLITMDDKPLVFQLTNAAQSPAAKARYVAKLQLEYEQLIRRHGGQCENCGTKKRLEVHHKKGRDYEARKLSSTARIKRYLKEEKEGVELGVLCKSCNSSAQ